MEPAALDAALIDPISAPPAADGPEVSMHAIADFLEVVTEHGSFTEVMLPLLVDHPRFRDAYAEYLALERRFCHPHRSVLRWELQGLEEDVRWLLDLSPDERDVYLAQPEAETLYSWSLCVRLLELALDLVHRQPASARRLARLAIRLADGLPAQDFTAAERRQLTALARAHVGNAYRVEGRLRQAEECFEDADSAVFRGGWTLLGLGAEVSVLHSYLLRDQRHFQRACSLASEARRLARRGQRPKIEVWASMNLASIHFFSGHPGQALEELDRCMPVLQGLQRSEQNEQWYVQALGNRAMLLAQCGAPEKALQALRDARPAIRQHGSPADQVRSIWIEAGAWQQLGEWTQARQGYQAVIDGFLGLARAYDVALVTLELATLLLQRGETAEVRRLASHILPVFQQQGVDRETRGTLELFQRAALTEQLSLLQVSSWLQQLRAVS